MLFEKIIQGIDQAREFYNRLVIVVSPSGTGKTVALQDVQKKTGFPLLNLNLVLCREMLELTPRQRSIQLQKILYDQVNRVQGDVVLFDNIEILFDVSLRQDPLRLLEGISRNKTVVVAWSGQADSEHITYAALDHPEYKQYAKKDLLVIGPEVVTI